MSTVAPGIWLTVIDLSYETVTFIISFGYRVIEGSDVISSPSINNDKSVSI